jgi:hypothetical protein
MTRNAVRNMERVRDSGLNIKPADSIPENHDVSLLSILKLFSNINHDDNYRRFVSLLNTIEDLFRACEMLHFGVDLHQYRVGL